MITKTGIEYSENSDLSNSTTIEENGEQNSITIPSWPTGVELFCQAYVIDDSERINSEIESYMLQNWFYIKNEYAGQNIITFTWHTSESMPQNGQFEYSKDKYHWTLVDSLSSPVTVNMEVGEKVYMRCDKKINDYHEGYHSNFWTTDCSQIYSIGGNIVTLSYYRTNLGPHDSYTHAYQRLFQGSTTLIDASEVTYPSDNIGQNLFQFTFSGCSNLRTTPDFSNIKYVSFYGFYHALEGTAIETFDMNNLIRTGSYSFNCAFQNSSIRTVLMDNITNHEGYSSSGNDFYRAFYNCTNLQKGIDLSGFENTGTPAAPDLFKEMYSGCANMSEATAPKKITNSNNASIISNWLNGAGTNVSGTKTVYCPTGVTVPSGNSGVPTGWTRVDY